MTPYRINIKLTATQKARAWLASLIDRVADAIRPLAFVELPADFVADVIELMIDDARGFDGGAPPADVLVDEATGAILGPPRPRVSDDERALVVALVSAECNLFIEPEIMARVVAFIKENPDVVGQLKRRRR